jgi:probable rRNA maturation factor
MTASPAKTKRRLTLDLVYASPLWTDRRATTALLRQAGDAVLAAHPDMTRPRYQASVMLADDAEMRRLNAQFRNKDKATNVLSFPSGQPEEERGPLMLGDIAIGFETVRTEAARDGKTMQNHLVHLLVHGLLHLIGYDHLTPDEAEEMEALEVGILATLDIPDPYAEFELVPHPPVDA